MARKWIAVAALGLASALVAGPATAEGDIALFLGQKQIDDKEWDPISDLPEVGMVLTLGKRERPVQMAIDLLYAETDEDVGETNVEATTFEVAGGVRKFWLEKLRPFAGGGLAIIKGEMQFSGVPLLETDSDDWAIGYWVDGGFLWNVGEKWRLGLEARYSTGEIEIKGEKIDGGGTHIGLLVGWAL